MRHLQIVMRRQDWAQGPSQLMSQTRPMYLDYPEQLLDLWAALNSDDAQEERKGGRCRDGTDEARVQSPRILPIFRTSCENQMRGLVRRSPGHSLFRRAIRLARAGFTCAASLAFIFVTASCWAAPLSLVIAVERTDAAADCANESQLFAKVEQISQRSLQPQGPEGDAIRVVIHFDRSQDEYRADLEFQGPKPGERSLRDRSEHCAPLEDAVAVAIALLLDREVERRERESREVARAVSTIKIIGGKVEPKQYETSSLYAASEVQALFDSNVVPALTLAFGVNRSRGWLFESSALLMPPTTRRFETGEVSVSLVAGALRSCRLWGEKWQLGPCASFALGRLRGSGRGFDESLSSNLLWTAIGGELLLQRSLGERWEVGLHAAAWVPLRQQRFSVQSLGTAWNSSSIWPWLGLRLGVRFL